MLFSKLCALSLAGLVASAVGAPPRKAPVQLYGASNYYGEPQEVNADECTRVEFSRVGSIELEEGYSCYIWFGLNCEPARSAVCAISTSTPNLLEAGEGPCGKEVSYGVGYAVRSLQCQNNND